MKVRVLQLKSLSKSRYGFMDYEFAQQHGFNLKDYECIYEGEVKDTTTLEDLFTMYNQREKPNGYKGHSLSVSDIVELDGALYYCDDFGWKRITK